MKREVVLVNAVPSSVGARRGASRQSGRRAARDSAMWGDESEARWCAGKDQRFMGSPMVDCRIPSASRSSRLEHQLPGKEFLLGGHVVSCNVHILQ